MQPFTTLTAIAAPLATPNVDTDQIAPTRFMRFPRGEAFGTYLFHDLRFDETGAKRPGFVLNRAPYDRAAILVADRNFGCGSSREGAVWAFTFGGFRAVVASGFGDIFFNNALKNGLLPVRLRHDDVVSMREQVTEQPGASVTIDLERQIVVAPDGQQHSFEVPAFARSCLLKGLDDIGITLEHADTIVAFESRHLRDAPWLLPKLGQTRYR